MKLDEELGRLNEQFGLAGVLEFRSAAPGMVYASVTTARAAATVYLQGAHVTAWQPARQGPVLFLSSRAEFVAGKAIRGGVPVSFPWFAARHDGRPGPSHGFARIQDWTLAFAALAGEELHLTFTLGPTELSRSLGYDRFRLAYRMVIGSTLRLSLTVANEGDEPLVFEEALHTYYAVGDVRQVSVTGLAGVTYLDKQDGSRAKVQEGAVTFSGETDRLYLDTAGACVLEDAAGKRRITVSKTNSHSTVVWNPWEAGARKLADLGDDEWGEFVAVETVNAGKNAVTLGPGGAHTMELHVLPDGPATPGHPTH